MTTFSTIGTAVVLDEQERIQLNLKTIREYLLIGFPGFHMTENISDPSVCHRFTMTDVKTFEQYKLKVEWHRLSDVFSNPERINRSLVHGDIVGKMREAKGHYLYW